ncbi:hypothetical protein OROHE_021622 [Orobanche hederae]
MFDLHISRIFSLLLLFFLLLGDNSSNGAPFGNRKSGKGSSIFSLFNLKERSRFWSESVIRSGFDDLESSKPGKYDAINYTKAGTCQLMTINWHYNFHATDPNIVGIKVQLIVPDVGNIANYLKLLEVESMYLPVPVNFVFIGFEGNGNREFKLNAEELERWFTKIDHIFEHTRSPKIGEILTPFYKISMDREQRHHLPLISHINYNFSVHAIQMGEKVTSIFERAIDVFGRRDDISSSRDDGVGLWQVDVDMMGVIFTSLVEYLQLEDAYNIFILNPKNDTKRTKYGYRSVIFILPVLELSAEQVLASKNSSVWKRSGECSWSLDKMKRPLYGKHPMAKFSWTVTEETDTIEWCNRCQDALNNVERLYQGKDTADVIQHKVLQFLNLKNDDLKLFAEKDLKSGDFNGFHAECLTDTFIGNHRWAFIDLTAGPFSWGPSVGGEGVRTEHSLPNVEKTIGAVAEISEDEAEDHLQEAIQEKFAVLGEYINDHNAIDILLAEIDIYELFAFKHCKGRKVKLALCEELDERMQDLKKELQAVDGEESEESHKQKAIDALKRMENWNLFSDTSEDFQNYTVARDTFLSHLGATLWGSLRHIISPSLADGAFHYYEKISFQLFFITQEKVRHINQLPDWKSLMSGLFSLATPSQKVQFSQHMLTLSEDPALAMAFSLARRAATVPLLLVNGTYRKTVRSYLDSSILQHQLQRLHDHASLKGSHAHSRSTLEIPIFWFIHGDALLVDKHYQAKSLSDMVIVVQSDPSSWESHLQCNGKSLLWDLRKPIKAALAAVSEHLAGLLPLHLVYSQAHETAIEDWIWSSHERELMNKYNYVVSLWRRISTVTGELRYADALKLLDTLEDASKGFADYVNATVVSLHPIHCTRQRKVEVEIDMTTIPAFLVVILVLWFVLKPRRPKPKIN